MSSQVVFDWENSTTVTQMLIFLRKSPVSKSEGLKVIKSLPSSVMDGGAWRAAPDEVWEFFLKNTLFQKVIEVNGFKTVKELFGAAYKYFLDHGQEELFY